MRPYAIVLVAALGAAGACGGGTPKGDVARDSVPAAGQTTAGAVRDSAGGMADMPGMEGMQHPGMPGIARDTQRGTAAAPMAGMKGMQHPGMPGMAPAQRDRGAAAPMAGMDHGAMPGMRERAPTGAPRTTAGMEHDMMQMPGAARRPAQRTAAPMAGMQMPAAPMPGMEMPADAGEQKLDRLIAALVRDSVVRRRIQADSVLRKRWDDAAALAIVRANPDR